MFRCAPLLSVAVLAIVATSAAQEPAEENLGDTYYHLESKAGRVTTTFFGGGRSIAQRDADGTLHARLVDNAGTDVAQLTIRSGSMLLRKQGQTPVHRSTRRAHPTLDWANIEARRQVNGNAAEPQIIEVEFEGGLVARSNTISRGGFYTVLTRYGVTVGEMQYLANDQALLWRFPGLTSGAADPKRLAGVGGWRHTRTLAWANVQALAFFEFHSRLKATPPGLQQPDAIARRWWQKALDRVVPPVAANEPGCDGLHWLDNSVLRPCCDSHDRCYEYYGCTSRSWYWGGSWSCQACNWNVVTCFLSGGGSPYCETCPFYQS